MDRDLGPSVGLTTIQHFFTPTNSIKKAIIVTLKAAMEETNKVFFESKNKSEKLILS